jgi:hypothetical protein
MPAGRFAAHVAKVAQNETLSCGEWLLTPAGDAMDNVAMAEAHLRASGRSSRVRAFGCFSAAARQEMF